MERVIAVIGPTAVGKTRLSIDLACRLGTEIISGDSMLVYRGMDIGTAKPNREEQSGVPHHMIDMLEPTGEFSVVDFQQEAGAWISTLNHQGKIPILAGGTGLYVKALLEGYRFNPTPGDDTFRRQLLSEAEIHGNQYLHDRLALVAQDVAARLHPNDRNRVIRALEVHCQNGTAISEAKAPGPGLVYDGVVIGLMTNRPVLYERINRRVDAMICQGLVEEVARLLAAGVSSKAQSMQAIGYKEIAAHLRGEIDLTTSIDRIKQATRHFAKRQITWYKKMPYITWFEIENFADYGEMLEYIYIFIAG